MEHLVYIERIHNSAIFRAESGDLYSVDVKSAPLKDSENSLHPAMAYFSDNPKSWSMAVKGNSIGTGRHDITISLNPDLTNVIESMFQRLEENPDVIYMGTLSDLKQYEPE